MVLHIFYRIHSYPQTETPWCFFQRGYSDAISTHPPFNMGKNVLRIWQCFDPQWFQTHGFYPGKCCLLRQMAFHIWKLIKACQKSCIRTFTDCCACSVLDHKDCSLFCRSGFFWCFYGKFFYSAMLSGKAEMPQRTFFALCFRLEHRLQLPAPS